MTSSTLDDRIQASRDARKQFWTGFTLEGFGTVTSLIALFVFLGGLFVIYGTFPNLRTLATDFYANVSSELASIVITVLIIDRLNIMREEKRQKTNSFNEVKSHSNFVALDALVQIQHRNHWDEMLEYYRNDKHNIVRLSNVVWQNADLQSIDLSESDLSHSNLKHAHLRNSKLNGALLVWANLEKANLWYAELKGTDLHMANLKGANLKIANLKEANLENTNLQNADLRSANLMGVNLKNARMEGSILVENNGLWSVKCDSYTCLPDGSWWTEDTDLERYTNPKHPEFWQPTWVKQ